DDYGVEADVTAARERPGFRGAAAIDREGVDRLLGGFGRLRDDRPGHGAGQGQGPIGDPISGDHRGRTDPVQVGRPQPGVKLIEVRLFLERKAVTEQRFGNAGIAPMDGYDFVVLHDNEIAQQHPPFEWFDPHHGFRRAPTPVRFDAWPTMTRSPSRSRKHGLNLPGSSELPTGYAPPRDSERSTFQSSQTALLKAGSLMVDRPGPRASGCSLREVTRSVIGSTPNPTRES